MPAHWSKLPPVHGYDRVPDEVGTGRRLLKCRACGRIIPSLGVGYHEGGGRIGVNVRPCWERIPPKDEQPVPDWPKPYVAPMPVHGPPAPVVKVMPLRHVRAGQHVLALRYLVAGAWITPKGFPADVILVTDTHDGRVTLTIDVPDGDYNRHLDYDAWEVKVLG